MIKPTVLALHGSGSNAMIHSVQMARLNKAIGSDFQIESLEAPFSSQPGPGVLPFFDGCGPFKRWINFPVSPAETREGTSTNVLPSEVEDLVRSTVRRIHSSGGQVVGLIGFSQGTRIVSGLLKCAEIVRELKAKGEPVDELDWCDWSFALIVCGSFPPPLLAQSITSALQSSKLSEAEQKKVLEKKMSIPTFHVLGNQDEYKWSANMLLERCYEVAEGKSTVRELDIGHHYPVQQESTDEMATWMKKMSG